jgi:sugar lactone lactonase YvrE
LVKYDKDIDEVSILTNRVSPTSPVDPNSEVTYPNDLAIASDGRVFFTSCSDIVPMRNKEGFYDTFKAWMMGLAQVRHMTRSQGGGITVSVPD